MKTPKVSKNRGINIITASKNYGKKYETVIHMALCCAKAYDTIRFFFLI